MKITERQQKVFNLISRLSETEISMESNAGQSAICRGLKGIKIASQKVVESIVKDVLPYEYGK